MSELSYWINDDTNPADAVARARQVDSDEWIEFVDHFYQSCCDCGLTHRINIRNKTVGKKEVQFVRRDDLSCLMRDRLGKARTDALDARDAEIARLTAELAQTQRDRQAEHDLRVRLAGEAETLRALVEAAERDAERLKRGLKFYAEGDHFQNDGAFDTVSGEPQNFWCDQEGSMVEDGTVAKKFLEGWDVDDDDNWIVPAIDAARGGT